MVHTAVEAGLMKSVRHAAARASPAATAGAATVALASIARFADRERYAAPAAKQQVQNDPRHQALAHATRSREEWTGARGGAILLPLTSYPSCPGGPNRRGFFFRGRDDTPDPTNAGRGSAADDDEEAVSRSTARQDSALLDRRSHLQGPRSATAAHVTPVHDRTRRTPDAATDLVQREPLVQKLQSPPAPILQELRRSSQSHTRPPRTLL